MASIDYNAIAAQLGEDEATIRMMIEQADESDAAAKEIAQAAQETPAAVNPGGGITATAAVGLGGITVVLGGLLNRTKGPLNVMKSHKYAGQSWKYFPDPLVATGGFFMSAVFGRAVKAAVVYSGIDKAGHPIGLLLAFADGGSAGRKIYAECGPLDHFDNLDWKQVENKLDTASGTLLTLPNIKAATIGTGGKTIVVALFSG